MATWLTDHEQFKNVTAGIQSIAVIVAVLIGGTWTASTFITLGEVQKASLENQRLTAELGKGKSEQQRLAANGLGISIDARQPQAGAYEVAALVKITNRSSRHRPIDFEQAPLQVWKVDFDKDGTTTRKHVLDQANVIARSRVLRSGETVDYLYFFRTPQKGLYILTLLIRLDPEELKIHQESGGPPGKDIFWDGTTYVVLR